MALSPVGVEWIEAFLCQCCSWCMKVEECPISGEMGLLVLCGEREKGRGKKGRGKGGGGKSSFAPCASRDGGGGGSASFCFYCHYNVCCKSSVLEWSECAQSEGVDQTSGLFMSLTFSGTHTHTLTEGGLNKHIFVSLHSWV